MKIGVKISEKLPTMTGLLINPKFEARRLVEEISLILKESNMLASENDADINIIIGFENIYARCPGALGSICATNSSKKRFARNILSALAELGFEKRELNIGLEEGVYVCICHADSITDVELYNAVGYKNIAKKICDAIVVSIPKNTRKTRRKNK